MKKAVIIGGGEIGRKGTEYETQKIDKEIVALANKQSPNFLFLGFANVNHIESYFRVIKRNYRNLGCISKTILKKELDNQELILERFNNADIIYIGGGNTLELMKILKQYNMISLLEEAYNDGKVICGLSAGAIAICKYGLSDARKYKEFKLTRVRGIGLVDLLVCPHYNLDGREEELERIMKRTKDVQGVGLKNLQALKIIDGNISIISDSNDDISDPAGKFQEALSKLVEWNKKKQIKTVAMKEFEDLYRREAYPGLGTVKKLSIMHHLELIGQYLDKD